MDFDQHLGCYPLASYGQWSTQVDYVSPEVLERIQPVNRLIMSEQKEREMREEEDAATAKMAGGARAEETK